MYMFKNKICSLDVKCRCKEMGAKHIVYGIVYYDYFKHLCSQWDDIDNLTHVFYDDESFNKWVSDIENLFKEYGCTDMIIYAVHSN